MRNMIILLSFIVVFVIVYQKKNQYRNDLSLPPAERQVYYRVGTIDPRFHLTEGEARVLLQEAARVWEKPLGHQFFFYSPEAAFKVNFIYDQRQKSTIEKQQVERELADGDGHTQVASANFEQQKSILSDEYRRHAEELTVLNARISHHQQLVALVNSQGGVSLSEAQAFQDEKDKLDRDIAAFNQYNTELDAKQVNLNHQAEMIQSQVNDYNQKANLYNQKFGGKSFEAGLYKGNEINIYEYDNKDSLRLILAHELGHALGLKHSNDPQSLMYPILEKQNFADFKLTQSDIDLLYGRVVAH